MTNAKLLQSLSRQLVLNSPRTAAVLCSWSSQKRTLIASGELYIYSQLKAEHRVVRKLQPVSPNWERTNDRTIWSFTVFSLSLVQVTSTEILPNNWWHIGWKCQQWASQENKESTWNRLFVWERGNGKRRQRQVDLLIDVVADLDVYVLHGALHLETKTKKCSS